MNTDVDPPKSPPRSKPLALLIPGIDGTGLLYYRQLDALSEKYRVRPWWFRPRCAFDFDNLLDELEEGTQGEEPESILVVGESFGGTVAMHYVLAFPERVSRLYLINTFPYYRRRVRIRLARLLAPILKLRPTHRVKGFIVEKVLRKEGIAPEDRMRYHTIVKQVDLASYQQRLRLVQRVDLRDRLGEISVPTTLFASGRDKLVPSVREARLMASRLPNAVLHEFPRAGHALLLTPGFSLANYG